VEVLLRTAMAARLHLSKEITSMVPWISTRSRDLLLRLTGSPRMAFSSASLFLLLVMKLRVLVGIFYLSVVPCGIVVCNFS